MKVRLFQSESLVFVNKPFFIFILSTKHDIGRRIGTETLVLYILNL